MAIDFKRIENIFHNAENENLLEHEVYGVLDAAGISTPENLFVNKGGRITESDLAVFPSENLVLKIVSPLVQHKSDVGGVRFCPKDAAAVNNMIFDMVANIPLAYLHWLRQYEPETQPAVVSEKEIALSIKGVLVCEAVIYSDAGFGSEILLGLRNTREFGPIITMGAGGLEVEFMQPRLKTGQAAAITSAFFPPREKLGRLLNPLALVAKVTRTFRGRQPLIDIAVLQDAFFRFQQLGQHFFSESDHEGFVIEEAEVNPLVIRDKKLVALDGLCRISRKHRQTRTRPNADIRYLLEPDSIGIIGVSEKMNIGHIILNKVLKQGFPQEKIFVIKPDSDKIEGCTCVPTVADLNEPVDLLVLAVSADLAFSIMQSVIAENKARSVIIIAGGIGEKKGTQGLERELKKLLSNSRDQGGHPPVVNGGNCLGIFSRPGKYDTTFVPEYKIFELPRTHTSEHGLVYLSQSGAFMISRMSRLPGIIPLYAVSIGNQIDLTFSDYMRYFSSRPEARIIAVYIEGFLPGDGLAFARAAAEVNQQTGKAVVVYKAGRSEEGRAATAGHTASIAGDYATCREVLQQTGVFLAETIVEFENCIKGLCFLDGKKVGGTRLGLLSNAGFECVVMSDGLTEEHGLRLASFSSDTVTLLSKICSTLGIDRLQDISNPLDITPVADDDTICRAVEAILNDDNVDCTVISPLPMSPALNSLPPSQYHNEDFAAENNLTRRLCEIFAKTAKPLVVCLDAGDIYRPMRRMLEEAGVPVFLRSDEAVAFMQKYVSYMMYKDDQR